MPVCQSIQKMQEKSSYKIQIEKTSIWNIFSPLHPHLNPPPSRGRK